MHVCRAAYASMESAHAALKAQAEEVEGARENAVAQYAAELDAGGFLWIILLCPMDPAIEGAQACPGGSLLLFMLCTANQRLLRLGSYMAAL